MKLRIVTLFVCLACLLSFTFSFASYGVVQGSLCGSGDSGDGNGGGSGGGGSDPGDEGQTLDGPDANVANGFRVRPVGGSWQEIGGTFSPGQQLEASWFISNKGDETIDYFESC